MKKNTPPTLDLCRAALLCYPPDCDRETWLKLGMALHAEHPGADGFAVFDEWSAKAETYKARAARDAWRSFKPGPVKVGTLFALAKAHGFTFEAVQTPARKPTQAELKAQAEARRAAAERERAETAERHRQAAAEALRLWESGLPVNDPREAPYLQRKGVQPFGVRRLADGTLLIPARTAAGELVNVQRIAAERPKDGPDKLFLKGASVSGTLHLIGPDPADLAPGAWLLVGEGYATCATVHQATGRPVAVAWNAGNLPHVVRALRGRYPAARLALCADDDRPTEARTGKNPGRLKATEAARLAGKPAAPVILPVGLPADGSAGSDFNDLQARAGLAAVRDVIERALAEADARAPGAAATGEPAATPADAASDAPAGRQRAAQGAGEGKGKAKGKGKGQGAADTGAASRDGYRVDDDGLWFDPPADDAGDARPVRVCAPLIVEGIGRDSHDNGAALLLQFDTVFGTIRRWPMPRALLAGEPKVWLSELYAMGFDTVKPDRKGLLCTYLQTRRPRELVRMVDRVGWHHGRAYVLPRETLGESEGERILFQAEAPTEGTFDQRGTLERWHALIGRHCIGNARLSFFASLAFAGPLLAWAPGTDGGGFHLVGDSSCGKTTALRVAASVWGGRDYLQRWRATDNGLESLAAQHSDALLCLDELAQLDAKVAGESAYMLANGQGKSRAGRTGAARPRQTWRLLFASAGEIGLAEHMAEAGKRTRAGQELRMIDLPADAGAGRGLFEDLADFESPGALAQHLTRAAETTYGTAGRAWLLWLVDHTEGLARLLRERMDATERELVPEAAAGQVQRVGRRFALVAAAGELATEAGVTGWPAGTATAAARRCFADWLAVRRGGVGLSEEAEALRQVKLWLQANGFTARCPRTDRADDDRAPQAINQAGWRKPVDTATGVLEVESWEWLLYPEPFAAEVCKGLPGGDRAALRLLSARGHLAREGKHFACRRSVKGVGKFQCYVIRSSILDDAGD